MKNQIPAPDYRAVFAAIPESCLLLRPDFTIAEVSERCLHDSGRRRDDVIDRDFFQAFGAVPAAAMQLRGSFERVLRTRLPDRVELQIYGIRRPAAGATSQAESRQVGAPPRDRLRLDSPAAAGQPGAGQAATGQRGASAAEERQWQAVNTPIIAEDRVAFILHRIEDVTEIAHLRQQLEAAAAEQQKAQAALRETHRLDALGRIAGGVAHDFNNMLTVIQGGMDILGQAVASTEDRQLVDMMRHAAERGARMTRQLLTFSRQRELRPEITNLASRYSDLADLLAGALRGDISTAVSFAPDLWPIECDAAEFETALLNIAANAREAMPRGGLLRIEGRNVRLPDPAADDVNLSGEFVALSISDSGGGIEPEILSRVFEPFFTTKKAGEASGLGLSQVYGFAFQMGGRAAIRSEAGHGTTVTLYLPRAMTAEAAKPQAAAQAAIAQGSGTILVVEDDDAVAATAGRLFELIGYQTIRAADGRTALEILLGGQKVDMVFSDVIMPGGMTGIELAQKIHRHFPQQPILLATGYSRAAAETAREGLALIAKPYRVDTLAEAVRRTIAGVRQAQRASA